MQDEEKMKITRLRDKEVQNTRRVNHGEEWKEGGEEYGKVG